MSSFLMLAALFTMQFADPTTKGAVTVQGRRIKDAEKGFEK